MLAKSDLKLFGRRLLVCFLIALVLVVVVSEVAYRFQKDKVGRQPQVVELVIPAGTAARVAAGDAIPTIPEEMDFLIGDILTIENRDEVDHQLGPVWVPPGTKGSLSLDQADNFAYSCSFQASRYLGINVRQPTTLGTRLTGLALAVPPTTMVLLVYSVLLFPFGARRGQKPAANGVGTTALTSEGSSSASPEVGG